VNVLCTFEQFAQLADHAALVVDLSPVQQPVDHVTIDQSRMTRLAAQSI